MKIKKYLIYLLTGLFMIAPTISSAQPIEDPGREESSEDNIPFRTFVTSNGAEVAFYQIDENDVAIGVTTPRFSGKVWSDLIHDIKQSPLVLWNALTNEAPPEFLLRKHEEMIEQKPMDTFSDIIIPSQNNLNDWDQELEKFEIGCKWQWVDYYWDFKNNHNMDWGIAYSRIDIDTSVTTSRTPEFYYSNLIWSSVCPYDIKPYGKIRHKLQRYDYHPYAKVYWYNSRLQKTLYFEDENHIFFYYNNNWNRQFDNKVEVPSQTSGFYQGLMADKYY